MNNSLSAYLCKCFLLLLSFTLSEQSVFCQTKLTLGQTINFAVENNLDLKKARIVEKLSASEVRKSKTDQYPDLFLGATGQINFGRSLDFTSYSYVNEKTLLSSEDLSANVTLFNGLKKINQIRLNKLNLEADKSNTQRLKNEVILGVISIYLKLFSLKDQLKVAAEQNQLSTLQLEYVIKNFEAGKKSSVDVSRIKLQIAKGQLNSAAIENEYKSRKLDLIQLINLGNDANIDFIEPVETYDEERELVVADIFKIAKGFLPQIAQSEFEKQAAIKEIALAKSNLYPRLTLTGNVTSNYSRRLKSTAFSFNKPFFNQFNDNLYQYFSLNLSIPIFNKFHARISIDQAKLNLESAEINQMMAQNELYKIVNKAINDFDAARKTYLFNQEALKSSVEVYTMVKEKYTMGMSSSLDLNQALNEMNRIQLEIVQSKYETIFRQKIINFYLGRPIAY